MGKEQIRTLQSIINTISLVLIFSFLFSNKVYAQCLPGDIGGTVFLESPAADASTANIYGVENINETGISGVAVVVVDPNGAVLYDTTDASGNWNITPAAFPVRVEFSWTDTWLEPSPNALVTANSDIQFFAASDCAASLGLYYPDEYCDIAPNVVTTCYVSGDPLAAGSTAPVDAVVSFQYDWLNDTVAPYHDAVMSDVGAIWGVAYSRRIQNSFFAAIMKRHVGLGPVGIGGLYRVDYSTGTANPSSFISLSLLGVDVGTEPVRTLSADYDSPNTDPLMFDAPGKLGLGDIEISDDGNTLFVINLKSKKVVTVDLSSFNVTGSLPGTAQIDSLPALPNLVCNNGEMRPFALKYRRGKIYVGAVCSGENGGTATDLTAIVYEYDMTAGTWSEAVNEFSLDYTKGGAQDMICNTWSPWIGVYDTPFRTCQPTPMFSDIEFDSDSTMILVFADRYTFQKFTLQRDSANTGFESVINGGDVLRAYYNGTNYSMESGGLIPNGDGCGANGQGIGGGEFFCGDSIGSEHSEIVLGAAAVLSGTGEVMLTTINPVNYNSGGVRRFSTTTGSSDTTMGYELYVTPGSSFPGGNGYAVKGGGIGDLELLCESPPIEVYSFIWEDTNNDGIQDPNESGIANVNVSLYDINGNLQWIDSTDANGFFSFSDTLTSFTDYFLVIGNNGDFNLIDNTLNDSLVLTLPNTGMGSNSDKNDSDFTIASGIHPSINGYPTFAFTTGNDGANYHGFDIGFFPPCTNPGLVTTEPTICLGSSVDMTTFVTDTAGTTGTTSFYNSLLDANAETNAVAALVSPTDTMQYYVRKNATDPACFDIDSLIVNVNPLPNLLTNDLTICIGDTVNINLGVLETTSIPVNLTYYATYTDALAETNALVSSSVYPTDTTEYYIRANAVASPNCSDIDSLIINVDPLPNLLTSDITICSGGNADLSTNVSETAGLPVNFTYYATYADALGETNAIASIVSPTDTTQYFVKAIPTSVSTCSSIDSLTVNVDICTSYDLALLMDLAVGQSNSVDPGDTLVYTMWVYNQGTMPAYDIVLTTYVSTNMTFDNTISTNSDWILVAGNPTDTLSGPLAAGDSISIDLAMVINDFYNGASVTSFAEISSSDDDTDDSNTPPTDEDSVTDLIGLNDPYIDNEINDNPDNAGDDDDHDGSVIFINSVFDLAFAMDAGTNLVDPCDTLTYTSWVYNQGNTPAYNVEVTNYLATGMNFDGTIAGNGTWALVAANPTSTIAGPIVPGDSASVTIALVVDCAYVGTTIDNSAELSGYDDDTDGTNAGPTDEDSVTDTDGTNDPNIDNEINDSPDNPGDDDDHDGSIITVTQPMAFDLALAMGTPVNPVAPCDTVIYTMWVYNQGDVAAYNVSLVDYVPSGMTFDGSITTNAVWALVGGVPMSTIAGPIAAGDSSSVDIALIVDCSFAGTSTNNAVEIASYDDDTDGTNAGPTDEDSVTDTDGTNDPNIDNEINDNPDNPADDDDHDGSIITVTQPMAFDLALLMQTPTNPVAPCDTVSYTMVVYNQGDFPAYDVAITNYLAAGMNFDPTIAGNAMWTMVGGNPTGTIAGPIAAGANMSVTIELVVDCAFAGTAIDHAAELSAYDDDTDGTNAGPTDEDSVTDTDGTNDANIDDEINDNPDNPADDDDHDGASITVTQPASFDLALLMPTPVNPVNPCDTVVYEMWVYNQGPTEAYNVSVANYIGTGMSFDAGIAANTQWTLVGGTPIQTIAGPIASGDSAMVSIALVVDCAFTGASVDNAAEIIGYDDDTDGTNAGPTDEDSVTDMDPSNDANIDNEINDNPDNPADDDDHDGAVIAIGQTFDLALLMQNPAGSVNPCDTVNYTMVVYNQGTVPAYNVTITDYLPTEMTFDATLAANAAWSLVAGEPTITLNGPIAAGSSVSISISLILDCTYTGVAISNTAEISGYDDDTDNTNAGPLDSDSVTDTDGTNDQNIDDEINNNPDNPADDDDHDGAITPVNQGFDLALTMATPANPVGPCDTVTYTMWVFNQGNTAAYNIALSNYTPTGMTFDPTITVNAAWASVAGLPTYVIAGPLAGGDSISVDLALVVDCGTTVTSTNNAVEISAYDDDTDNTNAGPTDEDSVTDTDSTNDLNIDDEYNDFPDNPGDDDDHDGATITIVIPTVLTVDTLNYTTPYETSVPNICVDLLELGAAVDQVVTCNFPANGVLVINSPSECVTYIPSGGYSGQDTACVAICDAVGNCDTTILIFTIEVPCSDILAVNTLTADLADCADQASFCLDIPIADVNLYSFHLDGNSYAGGIQPCDYDTTYVYTYFSLPGNGSAGPYMIDLWGVSGIPFSGLVNDMQALTDSMNVWDPAGNWMLDLASFSIRGGASNTYTDIDVTQMGSGMTGTIPMTLSLVPNGTGVNIASGNHEFVIVETASGCRDTIDVAVSCPGCNDIFGGPYTIEADNCDTTASFCTPIILSDIFNYTITDNGTPFTGLFGGCDNDTIILYNYVSIPGNGSTGPYEVENWTVNGFMYEGVFQDILALVDSMNTWDASGNWTINGFNIEGGNYLNTYGNIVVAQFGTVVSILNPNIQLIPASAAVFLESGPHELIFIDSLTGCIDTAMVQVDCVDCEDIVDDVLALTAGDCDASATFCMDISPNDIANYTITVNGQVQNGSFLGCENDTMTTYLTIGFNNPGAYILDSWTVDGMTYSAVNFGTAQELVDSMNVWDPTGNWSLNGLLIVGGDNGNNYSTILVSSGGMNVANADANIQLFPSSSAIALDTGTYTIMILDNLTGCLDSSAVTVTCPPAPVDCDFIADDFVPLTLSGCVGEAALCIELNADELVDYMVFDNGSLFTGTTEGCVFDSIVIYNYSFLTGGGNMGPYMLDSWSLNGQTFSGQFDNIGDLIDSLNTWDPLSPWSNDVANSIIRGPLEENNYGTLEITHIGSATSITIPVEYEQYALSNQFGLNAGSHELIFVNQINGCIDTIDAMVACIDPAVYVDTIAVGAVDTLCFDLSELPGAAGGMVNFCESSSGEYVVFDFLGGSYCLTATGIEVGQDSACIEICDDLGFCDTTWITVVVTDGTLIPNAWPDVDTTMTGGTVVITVTNNDQGGVLGIDTFIIVNQPTNGNILVDYDNGNIEYTPNPGYCNSTIPDELTYAICNEAGCDTTTVSIYVLCTDLDFVSGFSPNGDGVNDYFMIEGIGNYPGHTLTIFNRWGNQVYYSEDYKNDWAGTFNEDLAHLPDGTYFYVFEDGQGNTYSGYVQIHR